MTNEVPLTLETLTREECVKFLAAHEFGHLGIVAEGSVAIFPVNYTLDGDAIGVRTDPGQKFDGAVLAKVAFEVDDVDLESHEGASVLVQGMGRDVTDAIDPASVRMRETPLTPWAPGAKTQWIMITARTMTGRRLARRA